MNPQTAQRIVIIGAGYAGMMAALRLAGQTKGQQITLINREAHFTPRVRLHQLAADQNYSLWHYPTFLRKTGIQFLQGTVLAIHPDSQTVEVHTELGPQSLPYDRLVYALGSVVDRYSVAGVKDHALSLSTMESAQQAAQRLRTLNHAGGTLAIVGGGLTGIEAATELAESYPNLAVKLITHGRLGAEEGPEAAAHLHKVMERLGIEVIENSRVQAVEAGVLHRQEQSSIAYDALLWAASFAVSPIAAQAGLKTDSKGRVLVDSQLRSVSHPTIYALGDAAIGENSIVPFRMSCQAALPMGAYVGDQLTAFAKGQPNDDPFYMAYVTHCISLGRRDGLVVYTDPDDKPTGRIVTGLKAALVKEGVLRYVHSTLRLVRFSPALYHWPKAVKAQDDQGLAYANSR